MPHPPSTTAGTEPDSASRKRTLDGFLKAVPPLQAVARSTSGAGFPGNSDSSATSPVPISPGLTASGSSPFDSPSPNKTPTRVLSQSSGNVSPRPASEASKIGSSNKTMPISATTEPGAKRKKLAADQTAKAVADKKLKQERDAAKAEAEAEKQRRAEEREKKRREKEEADKQKAEQKAAKAAEKAEKEQEKKQRAEEKEKKRREKEEEEAKKSRSQAKLTAMFAKVTSAQPKESVASTKDTIVDGTPDNEKHLERMATYRKMFLPFHIRENTTLANNEVYDEETKRVKTKILEEYFEGKRERVKPDRSDPVELLEMPFVRRRGRVYPSVKKIMAQFHGEASGAPVDKAQMRHVQEALKSVPVKSIKFSQDVRPPYIGTISGLPVGIKSLRQLARRPVSRNLLPLDYDYDSEAEWQEEEGEDVDDLDDDDEEADGDEEMADFLDDSEDAGPARMVFSGGMEPVSTGLCWEDDKRLNQEEDMCKYKMEFIIGLDQPHGIDPFSTAYWERPKEIKPAKLSAARLAPPNTAFGNGALALGEVPANALPAVANGSGNKKPQASLPPALHQKLKLLLQAKPTLSKVGVVELFASENSCPKGQIKASFELLTEKKSKGWVLR